MNHDAAVVKAFDLARNAPGDEHPELPAFDLADQTRKLFDADEVTGCKSAQTDTKFFWYLF
jgi:hypothetical protein